MNNLSNYFHYLTLILFLLSGCKTNNDQSGNPLSTSAGSYDIPVLVANSSKEYIDQLGCLNCHGNNTGNNTIKTKAPDLSHAGLRYQPEYLFNYLQRPSKVRNHIGLSRMPDFDFDEKEALALAIYLAEKRDIPNVRFPEFKNTGDPKLGKEDFRTLSCNVCHAVDGSNTAVISDLSNTGSKINEKWLKKFIAAPSVFIGKESIMPGLLYHLNADSTELEASLENATSRIENLSAYLMSLKDKGHDKTREQFEKVKAANPQITVEVGKKIYLSQNCAGCHLSGEDAQWNAPVGPDLTTINSHLNKDWVKNYLSNPYAVRPFGFYPGSGSRMPDFSLSVAEVDSITSFIFSNENFKMANHPDEPSQFISNKVEVMLDEKFACLGCHSLGGKGGKIGPELSNLNARLKPEYIAAIISNPKAAMPGTIMPQIAMPSNLRNQLINYLTHLGDSLPQGKYLSLVDHPITLQRDQLSIKDIYLSKCAICHGENGNGDGFNAAYLITPPTQHADAKYMSEKPDDTLFDGIFAGGYILNKSHLMPAWGNTLNNEEITGLVQYMRELCSCNPPKWSSDNKTVK